MRDHLVAGDVRIPLSEVSVRFARSGGPGGQNVNKVETKVEVRFRPASSAALTPAQVARIEEKLASRLTSEGEIIVTSERTRYQERNREDALARLAALLTEALRVPKPRRRTKPTRASIERRLDEKKRRGETKRRRRPPE
ncbi:MAG: alternative ribosome rescue aminoacyl-tRNA hydrolase ArfB [Planctomycetota bacterium]|jgi:ribosome-associated protein